MSSTPLLLVKAAFKRSRPVDAEALEGIRYLRRENPYFKIDYANYQRYEIAVDWPDIYTHPCYLQMAALPLQLGLLIDQRSPFGTAGLVHMHNAIEQHHEFERGQPFSLSCQFGQVYRHSRGLAFEIVLTASQEGNQVYRAVGTFLDKRKSIQSASLPEATHLPLVQDDENKPKRTLKDLVFAANAGRVYAEISKDYNPIHLSALSAKLFGFKGAIVHGMYSMACGLAREENMLDFRAPNEPVLVKCDFFKPLFLPSKVKVQTGPYKMDRLIQLASEVGSSSPYLLIQYYRGEAARLHRRLS